MNSSMIIRKNTNFRKFNKTELAVEKGNQLQINVVSLGIRTFPITQVLKCFIFFHKMLLLYYRSR